MVKFSRKGGHSLLGTKGGGQFLKRSAMRSRRRIGFTDVLSESATCHGMSIELEHLLDYRYHFFIFVQYLGKVSNVVVALDDIFGFC